jgi:hypothetical protein
VVEYFEYLLSVGQVGPNVSGASAARGGSVDESYATATPGQGNDMENPHSERQAVLLERIVKNAVSVTS